MTESSWRATSGRNKRSSATNGRLVIYRRKKAGKL